MKDMSVCNLWEWAALFEKLDEKGVKLIYFEELTVFTRIFVYISWSK